MGQDYTLDGEILSRVYLMKYRGLTNWTSFTAHSTEQMEVITEVDAGNASSATAADKRIY